MAREVDDDEANGSDGQEAVSRQCVPQLKRGEATTFEVQLYEVLPRVKVSELGQELHGQELVPYLGDLLK